MLSMADFDLKKFFLLAVLVPVAVAILWSVPPWQMEQVRGRLDKSVDEYHLATLEDNYRRTLAQILGGLGLLYGLYLTQRRIVATEDNVRVAQENVSIAQENVRVAQEGQVTERFTRAIEHLGHKEIAIRLGGIYALERLAKDSEKDHGSIMEILTAYVRQNVPVREKDRGEGKTGLPTTDIQAILTVIGRRETTGNSRSKDRLDLTHTQLGGAALSGANLSIAALSGADLSRANLDGAALSRADLDGTALSGADLSRAYLGGADLDGANLGGADLSGADLSEAENLIASQVQRAKNWHKAHLPNHLKDILEPPA